MPLSGETTPDATYLRLAYEQALESYEEGGVPIGAVMVDHGLVEIEDW